MTYSINVHLLPCLADPKSLAGRTVVVIDVLRATTTIVHALAAGATAVIPCLEVDEARATAAELDQPCILGGERGGVQIEGFDLGNSPTEYTPEVVANTTVVFTSTNGTRAMQHADEAKLILIASFVNFSAVCDHLADAEAIDLICSGTEGEVTREDALLAGAIADELVRGRSEYSLNDQAVIAIDAWQSARFGMTQVPLVKRLKASQGGRNVLKIGQENDIEIAARIDEYDLVPVLNPKTGRIEAAK